MSVPFGPVQIEGDGVGYPEGYVPRDPAKLMVSHRTCALVPSAAALASKSAMSAPTTTTPDMVVTGSGVVAGSFAQKHFSNRKKEKIMTRSAAGEEWKDQTLLEWEENDFRIFCGDLGGEVNDELLFKFFSKYPSLLKARVVRDKKTSKSKGYGFVSFADADDFVKAMREMNGKYLGNRPLNLRKSSWRDRAAENKESFVVLDSASIAKKRNKK